MKRLLVLSVVFLIGLQFCFASGKSEKPGLKTEKAELAVMAGPTGFSSCALDDFINVHIYPSPAEAVANMLNGTLDMAVLPANKVAALYNGGADIKAVAITGEGMLSVLGTDGSYAPLNVPAPGDTPDIMAGYLYPEYKKEYGITAPAQLAQMLIAEKVKLAILPQPFVNMVLSKNPNVKIISNVQDRWKEITGTSQYPMSVLVASGKFAEENPELMKKVEKSYRKSVGFVIENPKEAGERIEKLEIMTASLAESAIPDCSLTYKNGKEAEKELNAYYSKLAEIMPEAIGNRVPDKNLYY